MRGVNQLMLTQTLWQLERNGLVIRHDFREAPPRVEYELSDTAMELLVRMTPLWIWIVDNVNRFREARLKYDKQQENQDE